MEQPSVYAIDVKVTHGDLVGDVVGTARGRFWHFVVPKDNAALLATSLGPMTRVDALRGVRVPLSWPERLTNARLTFGVMMPGQVLDQGSVAPPGPDFEYPLVPAQIAAQFENFDARNFATGAWELYDTVVMQFFLEAEDQGQNVYDSLRLVMRQDRLYDYRALMARQGPTGSPSTMP